MSKKASKNKSSKKHSGKKNPQKKNHRPAGGAGHKSMIRLSQCMIVKNEEKNIERALSWGKDIVCEQIVVDTGSTDRTVEIAEKMGAKVLHFEWIDDFAAAKNFALEQASGNWIAFLDADEYFQPEDAAKILPALEQIHTDRRIDFVRTNMAHLKSDGSVSSFAPQDRLFRGGPEMRYRYRIHEELYNINKPRMGCFDAQEYMMIMHTGYSDDVNKPEKGDRNARLLVKELEENPRDAMRLMYLGDSYNMADREEEALECYRKVLWDPDMEAQYETPFLRSGLQILRLRNGEPPEAVEEEFLKIAAELKRRGVDDNPDSDYYLGFMYMKKQDLMKGAEYFESALNKLKTYKGEEVSNMASDLALPNYVVAGAALNAGNPQKAVQFSVAALQADKFSPDGLKTLLLAFMTEYKPGMSVDAYWNFLYKLYDMSNPKDLLFIWKMAKETGFEAMESRAFDSLPPEIKEHIKNRQD